MSSNTIERFIWSFQRHFCFNAEYSACNLFQALDPRFEPKVFLVGILETAQSGKHEACVEPENDFWAKSERFEGLGPLIEANVSADPESKLIHSHPRMQTQARDRIRSQAIRSAIEHTISEIKERPSNRTFFVAAPRRKDGYWVSTVLSLQTDILQLFPQLERSKVPIHDCRDMRVATSLIDACVIEYQDRIQAKLQLPHAGEGSESINIEFTLTDSAALFMRGISTRMEIEDGNRDLYRIFNTISSLRYEKADGAGSYVIAAENHPSVKSYLRFSSEQSLDSGRASRKLLELASEEMPLHTDSNKVFGLCSAEQYNGESEDQFRVDVTGHQEWELIHLEERLMTVKFGRPALPSLGLDRTKLLLDLVRLFDHLGQDQADDMISLILQAQQEAHGTMLLISEDAEGEAKRLSMQATPITPTKLTPELLGQLTTIDGAVILSPDCNCFAIGAILDGLACEYGDPSRGARYNSAVRYVQSSPVNCLAVVVSEDGETSFLPDLPVPIKRADIDTHLATLKEINTEETFSKLKFNESRNWIERHAFYLLQADCDLINDLLPKLNAFHYRGSALQITSSVVFEQNEAMDPKLFYLESMK